ncbi:MAG: hypothetical protein C0600_15480 [Ignavibacteria bacterium]|nr:MAG: hypothetical protein C0600_15480 [Ignavibacteria bacterium]
MTERLKTEIEALVASAGAHLIELETRTQGRKLHLEVFVDTAKGISADELATLSRSLGNEIEERDLINGSYTLVVSSPGLERPLRFPWQYQRHTGRSIQLSYRDSEGIVKLEGTVQEVTEEQIVVKDGEGMRAIPFDDIEHAMIIATL